MEQITISLFEPGMTHLHRVGLAGLYMTLKSFERENISFDGTSWELGKDRITLKWDISNKIFFERLFEKSFGIKDGIIDFNAHHNSKIGDLGKLQLHNSILNTFLQHGQNKKMDNKSIRKTYNFDEKQITFEFKSIKSYQHQKAIDTLFIKGNIFQKEIDLAGWIFPGAAVRHVAHTNQTKMTVTPEHFICLLYAPVASIFYRLYHRGIDGQFDKRKGIAIVIPHIINMEYYERCFRKYLDTPVVKLSADGLGDAGLSALMALKANEQLDQLGIMGCSIFIMGTLNWSKQQKSRSQVLFLENISEDMINQFEIVTKYLSNIPMYYKEKPTKTNPNPDTKYFVLTSIIRGKIAENIAKNKDWFDNFWELMQTKEQAKIISYERGGLNKMQKEVKWSYDTDKKFVEAVHTAIRNRYGALSERAKKRGEEVRFDREFEKMRTGLMRAKNLQTFRAELADIFARGGINITLQKEWSSLLPLFTGTDWQRARDLALLGLASYSGKGIEEIKNKDEEEL